MQLENNAIVNISTYKFVELSKLATLKARLLAECEACDIKGTILLGAEGINLCLTGKSDNIQKIKDYLLAMTPFADLTFKESYSTITPFKKMVIKIKPEIVTMGQIDIHPEQFTGPSLPAKTFQQWLAQCKDMLVLDVRNDYEVRIGHFKGAQDLNIANFRDFPAAVKKLAPSMKEKTVVMYCTGGIRCEKASASMINAGFDNVYQLEGGILKYFEECGGEHYEGECFVFDDRVALNGNLAETGTVLCRNCHNPVTQQEQQLSSFKAEESCLVCQGKTPQNAKTECSNLNQG